MTAHCEKAGTKLVPIEFVTCLNVPSQRHQPVLQAGTKMADLCAIVRSIGKPNVAPIDKYEPGELKLETVTITETPSRSLFATGVYYKVKLVFIKNCP